LPRFDDKQNRLAGALEIDASRVSQLLRGAIPSRTEKEKIRALANVPTDPYDAGPQ
jgi:predicted XRE-type DNA-binding protein